MTPTYYFDHAASAPRRDEVAEAMAPWQHGVVGNPSGSHRPARDARRAIEEARDEVAAFVGSAPGGVIFTAGGTESCHLAIVGVTNYHRRHHATSTIVLSRVEHHAVSDAAAMMAQNHPSVRLRYVEVDSDGVVDLDSLRDALEPDTAIVSVMAANNETGVDQPLDGVSAIAQGHLPGGTVVHTDGLRTHRGDALDYLRRLQRRRRRRGAVALPADRHRHHGHDFDLRPQDRWTGQ